MRVLAFDPGYERLGVAVVEKKNNTDILVHSGCIRTSGKIPFQKRLHQLGEAVLVLIDEWQPQAMALEEVYFEKNAKTAMQIAEVRGMLTYLAMARELELAQFTPLEVKVAVTGYGKSDKQAVSDMVGRLIRLPEGKKRLDDELDAIAVGLTCLASLRYPHA